MREFSQAQCGWFEQATSYCETDALLRWFTDFSPAYCDPAVPLGLNADPGALALLPGGEPVVSHDWFGWPVICCGEFI